jgi:sugar phosphate isomerase/epimerase
LQSATATGVVALSGALAQETRAKQEKGAKAASGPGYRLGLVTWNVASSWDLKTLLSLCAKTGIGPVELRTTHKHGVEPTLGKDARKEVKARFADAGVTFWGCGSTCDFHWTDKARVQKQIETCKAFVELVQDLGGTGVKVRPNGLPKEVPVARTLEQIGLALRECGKAAESAGVEIWLEVHGAGTSKPEHVKTMMEQADHNRVGITWNSNAEDVKDGSVAAAFKLLRPWLKSCHINNLWSEYPWRELFSLLTAVGYDRATLIETPRSISDPDAALEFLRYYKALWTELTRTKEK